jgi:diketogulonate reductase-like aldo/keto reductase
VPATNENANAPRRLGDFEIVRELGRGGMGVVYQARQTKLNRLVAMDKPMADRTLLIEGVRVPRFLYGTAWKEDQTQRLTEPALQQGFRGIDTANQRRHYHEAAVGQAISASAKSGVVARDDLFLQTKFTFRRGQDQRLPYDPKASIPVQVEQSIASSLEHLGVAVIDSYLLHGPTQRVGLTPADWAAWRAMEAIHDSGRARLLGVSNVTLEQLQRLCQETRVRPRFVQNRCYAARGWDRRVREFCAANEVVYQGFSLLTANREVLARPELARIAKRHGRTVSQVVFRFALDVGMIPLTGTTDVDHMRTDLDTFDFHMEREEIERTESLAVP